MTNSIGGNVFINSPNQNVTWTAGHPSPAGGPTTFDEAVRKLLEEIGDLVIKKQMDYGTENILLSPGGPEKGITVRMWDKMARIKNLVWNPNVKEPQNESIEDTYKDIIGYSLLALMLKKGYFKLPLKRDLNA